MPPSWLADTLAGLSGLGLLGISLAFGLSVVVFAYAIGGISGCHINPAITIAMLVNGKLSARDALAYVFAQFIGASLAALVLQQLLNGQLSGFTAGEWGVGVRRQRLGRGLPERIRPPSGVFGGGRADLFVFVRDLWSHLEMGQWYHGRTDDWMRIDTGAPCRYSHHGYVGQSRPQFWAGDIRGRHGAKPVVVIYRRPPGRCSSRRLGLAGIGKISWMVGAAFL